MTNSKLAGLIAIRQTGLWTDDMKKNADELEDRRKKLKQKLHRLTFDRKRKRLARADMKEALQVFVSESPAAAKRLKKFAREKRGRPSIDSDQSDLLKSIVDIVSASGAADDRRRTELIRSCKTLDDLHSELLNLGYSLSRSATYLRLLPRNYLTTEGARHITTVPVKLVKAANNLRKEHTDAHFAASTIVYLKDLAVLMGSQCTFFLSQDDKARIPLGLPAASKQAPLLMHLEYRIQLPDHDWVVADRHKLIPSVYAGCVIKDGRVTYSGPTSIFIRSGKHDSSSAATHAADFNALLSLDSFKDVARSNAGAVKPIVIITVDGGPDENPRYPKTLNAAYKLFTEHSLDALFIACHAPGHSAYNAVERRMAPLSRDLSGLILPHDHFGSHLDRRGRTTDADLEKANFKKAGEILAEVWSQAVIDGFHVHAQYIEPLSTSTTPSAPTAKWCWKHVQQSQYFLQVVKCNDITCCGHRRTNYNEVVPNRFIPAPVPFVNYEGGIAAAAIGSGSGAYGSLFQRLALSGLEPRHSFNSMPFDLYCPSVAGKIHKRICSCGKYFPTQAAIKGHEVVHHRYFVTEQDESEEAAEKPSIQTDSAGDSTTDVVIIPNLFEWLQSEFSTV